MGWGFLMGAGKGLSGYADIMGEKRKQDFQLKRDELAFERSKALKDLEFQNQRKRDKSSQEHAMGLQDRREAMTREGWEREEEMYEKKKGDEMTMYEHKKDLDHQFALQMMEDKAHLEEGITQDKRDKLHDDLYKEFNRDGNISDAERLKLVAVKHGIDLSSLTKSKGKPMSADMLGHLITIAANNKELMDLAEKDPMAFVAEMTKMGDYIMERGQVGDSGGGSQSRAVDIDQAVGVLTDALASGKESPDSLRQKASTEAERVAVERAINSFNAEKQGTGGEEEEDKKSVWSTENMSPAAQGILGRITSGMSKWKEAHRDNLM